MLADFTRLNRDLPETVAPTNEVLRWALVGIGRQEYPLTERGAEDVNTAG